MLPLVAVLALLAAAGPLAAAQPIPRSGLPEPIGLAHLRRWAGAIELSPAQRHAALRALDEYRASWQEVLARPLPEGFAERGHVVRVWSRDPAAQRALLDARRRLVEAMATLDEAFFAALVEGLNDDQQVRLERVRDARARERLASPPVDVADFGWNVVDLAAVVEHAPRPAGEAGAAVGAILADYERAVLPRLEAVHAAATRVALDLAQTWHDAFTTPPTDEAEATALQAGLNAAFAEIWRRHAAAIDRLDDLNDRTWRRLEAVLPIDERIDWRRRWHDAQVHAGQTPGMQRWFLHNGAVIVRRALELDDLDAEARAALEALLARTEEREAALMDRSVAAKRESGAQRRDVLLGNRPEPARSLREILDEIGSEQHAIADEASRAVAEIAGAEWSKRRQAAREARRIASGAPAPLPPPPSTPRWLDLARTAESAAPEPLDAALLGLLVEVAQADGAINVARAAELSGQASILHAAYLEAFEADEIIRAARSARIRPVAGRDEETRTADLRAAGARFEDAARAGETRALGLLAEVAALDEALAGAPLLAVLEGIARRSALAGGGSRAVGAGMGRSSAGRLDPVAFALGALGDPAAVAALVPALASFGAALDAPVRARFDAVRRALEAEAGMPWTAEGRGFRGDLDWTLQRVEPARKAAATSRGDLRLVREEGFHALVAAARERLATPDAEAFASTLRLGWRRAAWPKLTQDETAVHDHLEAALALDDLRPDQREWIVELLAEYRADWERMTQAIVDRIEAHVDRRRREGFGAASQQDLLRDVDRLATERNERSLRIAEELRLLLDPAQLQRLPRLPESASVNANLLVW